MTAEQQTGHLLCRFNVFVKACLYMETLSEGKSWEGGSVKEEKGRERKNEKRDREAYLLACRQQFFSKAAAVCSGLGGKCVPLQDV